MTDTAKLFLTDYASYNDGSQFEFGHWVDLDQFSDAQEFSDYISNHFAMCDAKSPLYSGKREETMFTDYEGFPAELYSESMSPSEMENLFTYLNLDKYDLLQVNIYLEVTGYDFEYCLEHFEDMFYFDKDNAYDVMFELYPQLEEVSNMNIPGVIISEEDFTRDFAECEVEGVTYCVRL